VRGSVADLELHTYKSSHEWSRHLFGDPSQPVAPLPVHDCQPDHLGEIGEIGEIGERIVTALREDRRANFQSVALGLGVSESTVRRRFEALYDAGCVLITTLVPAAALGFEAEILFWLSVAPSRLDPVAKELAGLRGVRYVAATLGQESLMPDRRTPARRAHRTPALVRCPPTITRLARCRVLAADASVRVSFGYADTDHASDRHKSITGATRRRTDRSATNFYVDVNREGCQPRGPHNQAAATRTRRRPARDGGPGQADTTDPDVVPGNR